MYLQTRMAISAVIVVAISMAWSDGAKADGSQGNPFLPAALFADEHPALHSARTAFERLDDDVTRVAALSRIPRADFDRLMQQVAVFKQQLPGAQRALIAAVAKVRTAGRWTVEFDSAVLDAVRRSGKTDFGTAATRAGGPRGLIDQAASGMNEIGPELDRIVADLRPKSAVMLLLQPLIGVPASAYSRSIGRRASEFLYALAMLACATSWACTPF